MIKLGDRSPTVRKWREVMVKRFAGYARIHGVLPLDTDQFGARAQAWQKEYQVRTGQAGVYQLASGNVSDRDLSALGINPTTPLNAKPVIFTVEGHMSDMFVGPCAETARILEQQGVARWQPVGYNNTTIPFDNKSGIEELARLVGDTNLLPRDTAWGLMGFSQGGIVVSEFYKQYLLPGRPLNWRLKDLKRAVAMGNPYREKDVVAEWIPDPPKPGTQGISGVRMVNTPSFWKEEARTGDLYTENTNDASGAQKTEIYNIVQGQIMSMFTIILRLGLNPTAEVIAAVQSIISGVMFMANMTPHGGYDLGPVIEWMRGVSA